MDPQVVTGALGRSKRHRASSAGFSSLRLGTMPLRQLQRRMFSSGATSPVAQRRRPGEMPCRRLRSLIVPGGAALSRAEPRYLQRSRIAGCDAASSRDNATSPTAAPYFSWRSRVVPRGAALSPAERRFRLRCGILPGQCRVAGSGAVFFLAEPRCPGAAPRCPAERGLGRSSPGSAGACPGLKPGRQPVKSAHSTHSAAFNTGISADL